MLGSCVKVAEEPREEFSRLMLLFSLTDSWIGGEEDANFSQLMYVICLFPCTHNIDFVVCRMFHVFE